MGKKRDWDTAFWQAWDKLGVWGTLVSLVPSVVTAILQFLENPKSLENTKWGDFMNLIIIWLLSYLVMLTIGMIWYLNRKPKQLADVVSRETSKPRQFFDLPNHTECVVKNANASTVANYLLKKYTEIARRMQIGNITYFTDTVEFFDPKIHGTTQYAMIVHGIKETAIHGFHKIAEMTVTSDPLIESVDMFTITVSQGGENVSRITFDTDIRGVFKEFSDWLMQDLEEVFELKGKRKARKVKREN